MKTMMKDAHEQINTNEAAKENLKLSTYRVGSSGAIVDDKVYTTQCGRLAQARFLGNQSPPTQEMRVMFNGGLTLEDYLTARFDLLGIKYVKEREHNSEIAPGIVVSGRPDFELTIDGEDIGIEVKSLASPFSVMKQRKNKFPYMKHMIQSATYMTLLNKDKWLIAIGHSFHVNDRGMKIPPEVKWYELTYTGGLFIVMNDEGRQASLPFTKEHIVAFYTQMKKGLEDKQLMARPTEYELNVDTYNRCNYCPMKSACNAYDAGLMGFDEWLSKVVENKEKEQSE